MRWCTPGDVIDQPACSGFDGDPGDLLPFIDAASEILFARSGRQFGTRSITVRPYRCNCSYDRATRTPAWDQGWSFRGGWPGCTSCGGSTYAVDASSVFLGVGALVDVTQVKVDGDVLTEGVDFRVDEATWLVRLPDGDNRRLWPSDQRLDMADTEDGTWSVSALVGTPVPQIGVLAAAELACELSRAGQDSCSLSPRVQQTEAQGITTEYIVAALNDGESIGLPLCDMFIATYNPAKQQARARVLFPVPSGVRRTDTNQAS